MQGREAGLRGLRGEVHQRPRPHPCGAGVERALGHPLELDDQRLVERPERDGVVGRALRGDPQAGVAGGGNDRRGLGGRARPRYGGRPLVAEQVERRARGVPVGVAGTLTASRKLFVAGRSPQGW